MEGAERIKKYVEEKYGAMAMYDIEKSRALAKDAKEKILEAPLSYTLFHLSSVPIFFLNNDIILGLRNAFKISLPDVFVAEKVLTGNFSAIFDIVRKFNPAVLFLFFGSYALIFLKSFLGIGAAVYLSRKGDLKAFFPNTDLIGNDSFADKYVQNRDTRIAEKDGRIDLAYAFIDRKYLVIANSQEALAEIFRRFSSVQYANPNAGW